MRSTAPSSPPSRRRRRLRPVTDDCSRKARKRASSNCRCSAGRAWRSNDSASGGLARASAARALSLFSPARNPRHARYRLAELDERLTSQRIASEARCITRCRRAGVATPAIYLIDAAQVRARRAYARAECESEGFVSLAPRLRQRTLYFERISGITARAFIAEHCGETEEPAGERPDDEPEPSTRETAEAALAAGRGDSAPATEGMRKALSLAAAMGEGRARPARARARAEFALV